MIVDSDFKPAWWLPGPHLQTLWPALLRRRPHLGLRRERLELADGDFIDLDWLDTRGDPLVVLLHGLEGSVESHYIGGLLLALREAGMQPVVMHFRGCSGEPNRLVRSYHAGETGDLSHVIATLRTRAPGRRLAAVGFSLGGNVLLKWLGELGERAPLQAAIAVSVPFELSTAAARLERGFSRVYQGYLLAQLQRSLRRKSERIALPAQASVSPPPLSLREFDDRITAPLHGFTDSADYYRRCSSRAYLKGIAVPTLIVQARNDPFLFPSALPASGELSPSTRLELSAAGGHVGFVSGSWPWRARYWLEQRLTRYLASTCQRP